MNEAPIGAIKIIVEVTPPCDFAVDKKGDISKVLGGFFTKNPIDPKVFNKPVFYNFLQGVTLQGNDTPQNFIFDYRKSGSVLETDLKDEKKYKLLCRFKDKLFADIIQKSSAHTARLGIPFIK
jgi:hypothetical protein